MLSKHDDDVDLRTMKSEMTASLERRFDEIEQIEELCVTTMLDPRFKNKFFTEAKTRLSTRQYLIDNFVYTDDSDQPPNKRPCHDTTQDGSDQASSSKVWECFTELLEESGASSDMGGVEAMVDRYLFEPLIEYKKGDPFRGKIMKKGFLYWEIWRESFLVLHQLVLHLNSCSLV